MRTTFILLSLILCLTYIEEFQAAPTKMSSSELEDDSVEDQTDRSREASNEQATLKIYDDEDISEQDDLRINDEQSLDSDSPDDLSQSEELLLDDDESQQESDEPKEDK